MAAFKLPGLPDWLIHDLPEDEQEEMLAFVGLSAIVTEIESYGYFWIRFGAIFEVGDDACYSGHSFCVTRELIAPMSQDAASH